MLSFVSMSGIKGVAGLRLGPGASVMVGEKEHRAGGVSRLRVGGGDMKG